MANNQAQTRYYFIDEGGDSILFSRTGKVLIGSEGGSRFFMLGLLEAPDPTALRRILGDLRARLMSDPYFDECTIYLVQDIDDRRRPGYGMYYTQKKPLNAAALEWRQKKQEPRI